MKEQDVDIPDTADALNRALREEISKAFEEFRVSGTPYSSFTIFEAGYRAGMKDLQKNQTLTDKH